MSPYHNNPLLSKLPLGKSTQYEDRYNPALLQAVPRNLNRKEIHIDDNDLPFTGSDLWTLYELSWLNENGLPQVAIGEVTLPATSVNIIESKSFKLYLNSLNQTKFSDIHQVQQTLRQDLSRCAQGEISVRLFNLDDPEYRIIEQFEGQCIDHQDIVIDNYEFDASLLNNAAEGPIKEETLVSHLLKSNCLITYQPDWGSIQIRYRGKKINREALLRYIVSFRHHNEFHEQCVERIYCDLMHFCRPEKLMVYARYTRRGGLDINPYRTNTADFIPKINRLIRQ